MMRYVDFGTNSTKVSSVMLGTMRIGGLTSPEVAELVSTALDVGINAIDTADIYGRGRSSEELLGEAFETHPGLRDRVFLQTKCGISGTSEMSFYDLSKEHILRSVDASLARLRTDRIDSLLLHRPDALMDPSEIADAISALYEAGKVLDFGVSNQNPAQMALLDQWLDVPISANQLQLGIAHAPAVDAALNVNVGNDAAVMREGGVIEYCHMRGIAVQAWSPLQYGHMLAVFLEDERYAALNESLGRIADKYHVTPAAVAVAWVLRHPAKTQVVVGTTKPNRVAAAAEGADITLTREEWYELYCAAGREIP